MVVIASNIWVLNWWDVASFMPGNNGGLIEVAISMQIIVTVIFHI